METRQTKVSLITAPTYPIGSLYYIWKQSRSNKPLPSPELIESIVACGSTREECDENTPHGIAVKQLGFKPTEFRQCAKHITDEVEMILAESIPVVENLNFVFHLQNIPISLREQLVRHRIGTKIDPRVGVDIIPEPLSGIMSDAPSNAYMHMQTVPNLADSTWWSQTSRVIPFDTFYDEGRFIVPESLKGKHVKHDQIEGLAEFEHWVPAETFYLQEMQQLQYVYKKLMEAGVHIEDCRQLVPVGATHDITWGINLAAMLHIFGKRSSWIAQIGLWEPIIMGMLRCLVTEVHPMFRIVGMPKCIKKGKYVGCPVSGTNAERVAGIDGMPPCPLWVRYETDRAINAAIGTNLRQFPGRTKPAWVPPSEIVNDMENGYKTEDVRNWTPENPVEAEMLERTAKKFGEIWGFDPMEGLPSTS